MNTFYSFDIEFFLKNFTFLSLFLTMFTFWTRLSFQSVKDNNLETAIIQSEEKTLNRFSQTLPNIFFWLSFLCITFNLVFRWFSSKHIPLSNLYESLLFLSWTLLGLFLFFSSEQKFLLSFSQANENQDESLFLFFGGLLSSTVLFIQSFADWQLPNELREIKPLVPALQSNWLLMHVSIMILSYAALLGGCLLAIAYLIIEFAFAAAPKNEQKTLEFTNTTENFLNQIDSLSSQILGLAFPLLTLGILSGAVWANEAWGSYWSWDPKETWALITWLIFAFYIHTRLQYGWIGKKSAQVATLGFFVVWLCYLGVNLLGKGLHSYGWLSS